MKNIDKIRAMSAEELSKNLVKRACYWCDNYNLMDDKCRLGLSCATVGIRPTECCQNGIAVWLNQEVNPMPELQGGDIVKTYYGEYVAIGGAVLVNPMTMVRNFLGSLNDTVRFVYRYNGSDKRYETIWSAAAVMR